MSKRVTFVIGATASGKTTFIQKHFSGLKDTKVLNVYDYQQDAYREAGFNNFVPHSQQFKCLLRANENLLDDIIKELQNCDNLVVEHTLFKTKRRITYIDAIRNAVKDVIIEVYVMSPSVAVWETYMKKRKLESSSKSLKATAKGIEFPNPSEGFNSIYEVIDGVVKFRMDAHKNEIVDEARKELAEEKEQIKNEEEEVQRRHKVLESMKSRPFWHYCEVCGEKIFCTDQEAFDNGWDYPPRMGRFGLLGPRTCGKCKLTDTLYWKVHQQKLPIVFEESLTEKDYRTWQRIKNEPESLLCEE